MDSPKLDSVMLFIFISRELIIFFIDSFSMSCPTILLKFSKPNIIWVSSIFLGYKSIKSLDIADSGQISLINSTALLSAYFVKLGSIPRSNLYEESVDKLWCLALFLTEMGSKKALSKKIILVFSVIPEYKPPNIPARHIGFFESQISRSSDVIVLSILSKVSNFNFFEFRLITTLLSSILL